MADKPSPEDMELMAAIADAMPSSLIVGVDVGVEDAPPVYRCSCGYWTDSPTTLMNHVQRLHNVLLLHEDHDADHG